MVGQGVRRLELDEVDGIRRLRAPHLPPGLVDADVAGDLEEPGPELVLPIEPGEGAERPGEHLLREILGVAALEGGDEGVDPGVVALHELVRGLGTARLCSLDQYPLCHEPAFRGSCGRHQLIWEKVPLFRRTD